RRRNAFCVLVQDQVAPLLMPSQARRLAGYSFFEATVSGDDENVVIKNGFPERWLRIAQPPLSPGGHCHADRVADALTERAGGHLDAEGVAVLGMSRGE